jgi:hypothetical protein
MRNPTILAYEILAIADGTKTITQVRDERATRERNRHTVSTMVDPAKGEKGGADNAVALTPVKGEGDDAETSAARAETATLDSGKCIVTKGALMEICGASNRLIGSMTPAEFVVPDADAELHDALTDALAELQMAFINVDDAIEAARTGKAAAQWVGIATESAADSAERRNLKNEKLTDDDLSIPGFLQRKPVAS